ncbi:DUF1631 family protein [Marinobacter apostichopi]|uniref:DUF1631 family protein n=1 Tax=Marinobacter apostichopi TaxID=3035454 RepID=UPI002572C974|nr:DUF1631 family protein [Marinobacter sp. LA51]
MISARRVKSTKLLQDALLVCPALNPCGCVVSRIEVEGDTALLYISQLTSPAVISRFASGDPGKVDLHILGSGGLDSRLHLRGILRASAGKTLVLTAKPSASVLANLNAPHEVIGRRYVLADKASMDGLKRLYQQHAIHLLERLLPDFLDTAGKMIEQELENAAEMREITRLKDMRFIFASRQPQICQDFEARFTGNNTKISDNRGEQGQGAELHVLQQQAFEDWLDLQTVAARLAGEQSDILFALHQLLNQIFRKDITESNNPLTPGALCTCLQYAIDRLGIANEHRHTIYSAFESSLREVWAPSMRALIDDCAHNGLNTIGFAQLPPNWSARGASSVETERAADTAEDDTEFDTDEHFAPSQPDHHQAHTPDQSLFRLMGLAHGGDADLVGWQQSSPQFCADLKPRRSDLLEKLQTSQPELSQALRELAEADPDFGNSVDEPTLAKASLVDQLFAPLQTQQRISGGLRDKLEQLKLPVFEALLDTPEFLNDEDHPAREILNDLMRLCLAERASTKNLETTVSGIIEDLINAENLDSEQLQLLNGKLKTLVERQDQSFVRNSERLAKTLEGKERLKKTRNLVQQELNTIVGGQEIPTVLLTLLAAGWEQLMVLALLREGPGSHYYGELLEVVKLLKSWLTPDSLDAPDDELAFERELESANVLRFIDRELRTVGDIARFQSLMTELTGQLQRQKSITTAYLEVYGEKPKPEPEPSEAKTDRWAKRARELTVGDWVEITLDSGETRKLRLVWGGEDVLRFVFLSPTGMSEISFDFQEFVQKLRLGTASLIEEGDIPFVDQSLFNMVQDVYRRLNFEATHDALTKCMRRHDFEKLVSAVLARGAIADGNGALVVLDIDEFSVINSTYGAKAGDKLLEATGALVQKHCASHQPEPHAGRISGNEFAILIDGTAIEESLDFAEHLRQAFEDQEFTHDDAAYKATLSVSVCPITDTAESSAGDLLNSASLSLKSVKRLGGNRVELVKSSSTLAKPETPQWVSEIDRSINDGSLFIRAQPIVPLIDTVTGGKSYELLLGLTDSAGNQISPQAYIEAAEKFRRSTRVDLWVVQEVLAWMNGNPDILEGIDTLNVNLSGASLSDDRFMLDLEALLRANRNLTPKICFEVTETSAVANLHYAADFMRELKRLDCRFALDDFGTGLSSYAYLQKLPVDYVKIDGIFVKDMATNLTNYAMVRSINELCHFLDLKTIAEYVENMEIMETLREVQVDYAQGFGIARPCRLDSLTAEIRTSTGLCL